MRQWATDRAGLAVRGRALLGALLLAGCNVPLEPAAERDPDLARDGGRSSAPVVEARPAALEPRAAPRRAPPVVGALAEIEGLRVLRMAGTPREMGFQHGRELAAEIKEGIEQFVLGYRCHGIRARYAQIQKRLEQEVDLPAAIVEELDGMVAGMQASGIDLALPLLKRDLERADLVALNTIDHWGLFGCSGFTAWGSATDDGSVLVARNFDFDVDRPAQAIARLNVVLAFEPAGGRALLSLAFPGLIGVTSGVNDAGVGAFLHVGNGAFGGGEPGRTRPPLMVARELLERCDSADAAGWTRAALAEARVRNSFLFRVTTDGIAAPATAVFEVDPIAVVEQPQPARGEPPLLIATNHFLARSSGFAAIPDSKVRYCSLEECADARLADGDGRIDAAEAWEALGRVAQERGIVTLHSMVWRPRTRELLLGVSAPVDGEIRHAAAGEARRLFLDELLELP